MRTANNDHGVVVPPVDVYSYKHIAYLVDAFLYFFKVLLALGQKLAYTVMLGTIFGWDNSKLN